jgi:hypothetical protein
MVDTFKQRVATLLMVRFSFTSKKSTFVQGKALSVNKLNGWWD